MKKVLLFTIMLLAVVIAKAQEANEDSLMQAVIETGVYEVKKVVKLDGVNASTLYVRAMEALSDWTGTDGNSRAGLDFYDKEAGVVNYKGVVYNGSRKMILNKMHYYTEFMMKVRCKDGRAQITVSVPSMYVIMAKGEKKTFSIREVVKQQMKRGEAKNFDGLSVRDVVSLLVTNMEGALTKETDDDF